MLDERCHLSGNVAHVGPCWVYLQAKCQERPNPPSRERVCDSDRSQREREKEKDRVLKSERKLHATAVSALQPLCKTMVKLVFLNAAQGHVTKAHSGGCGIQTFVCHSRGLTTLQTHACMSQTDTRSPTRIRTRSGILHRLNDDTERLPVFSYACWSYSKLSSCLCKLMFLCLSIFGMIYTTVQKLGVGKINKLIRN